MSESQVFPVTTSLNTAVSTAQETQGLIYNIHIRIPKATEVAAFRSTYINFESYFKYSRSDVS
jgi:hypothetical protein